MTRVGDIVTGRGTKAKAQIDLLVTDIGPSFSFVSGRVIKRGRLTNRLDTIGTKPFYDIFTGQEVPGGWKPSDESIKIKESLSEKIRSMNVGDVHEICKTERNINTCRSIAARIAIDEGRVYSVNRTENGCTITRKE